MPRPVIPPAPAAPTPLRILRQRQRAVALTEALLADHGHPVTRELHEALVRNAEVVRRQILRQFGYVPVDIEAAVEAAHAA